MDTRSDQGPKVDEKVTEILSSPDNLERWILSLKLWSEGDKPGVLIYNNCGYVAVHAGVDFRTLVQNLSEQYPWVKTVDNLEEAMYDAISPYMAYSTG